MMMVEHMVSDDVMVLDDDGGAHGI